MWAFRHCSPFHFSRSKLLASVLAREVLGPTAPLIPRERWAGHGAGVEALATLKLHTDVFQPFIKLPSGTLE